MAKRTKKARKKRPTPAWHRALIGAPVPWVERHELSLASEDMPAIEKALAAKVFKIVRVRARRKGR